MAFVDAFEAVILVKTALPSAGRYGIMLACWQGEPKERPTFPALVQILGDLLQDNSLPVSSAGEIMSPTFFCSFSFLGSGSCSYFLQDGKDYIPLNHSQNSEDDGFSQASSRPPSEEELRLACNTMPTRYKRAIPFYPPDPIKRYEWYFDLKDHTWVGRLIMNPFFSEVFAWADCYGWIYQTLTFFMNIMHHKYNIYKDSNSYVKIPINVQKCW